MSSVSIKVRSVLSQPCRDGLEWGKSRSKRITEKSLPLVQAEVMIEWAKEVFVGNEEQKWMEWSGQT